VHRSGEQIAGLMGQLMLGLRVADQSELRLDRCDHVSGFGLAALSQRLPGGRDRHPDLVDGLH
jgi:hypothetical protein